MSDGKNMLESLSYKIGSLIGKFITFCIIAVITTWVGLYILNSLNLLSFLNNGYG